MIARAGSDLKAKPNKQFSLSFIKNHFGLKWDSANSQQPQLGQLLDSILNKFLHKICSLFWYFFNIFFIFFFALTIISLLEEEFILQLWNEAVLCLGSCFFCLTGPSEIFCSFCLFNQYNNFLLECLIRGVRFGGQKKNCFYYINFEKINFKKVGW